MERSANNAERSMKKMEMKVTGWAGNPVAVAQAAIDAATGAGLEAGTGSLSFGNALF